MNAWNATANVRFVETRTDPQVRIAREDGGQGGYWSYLGVEILRVPPEEQTMNLEGFTMNTPEPEFRRIVRHETGHTLGFPHEHMRKRLVARIDAAKAFEYYRRVQNWDEDEVRSQVLTPIETSSIFGTLADPKSIMCYQIPGEITRSGRPILGGVDISTIDYEFASRLYPKPQVAKKNKAKSAK
jgi:hypothetical protein